MDYKTVLLVIASVLLTIQPSTSSSIGNEKLVALSERFDILQSKVDSLEAENEGLKIRVDSLQIKVDHLEGKDFENEAKIRMQKEEIVQFKAKMDAKLESIKATGPLHDKLVTDLRSPKDYKISMYRKEGSSDDSSTREVVPSSCRELSLIGHSLDGLYLVQNRDTKKVETVLCIFGSLVSQDFIGYLDVKTKSAHFYVQRSSNFGQAGAAVIPFDLERLNEGSAFNLTSGIFTVPAKGIYHFDLSAQRDTSANRLDINLQVNGINVGNAYTSQSTTGTYDAVSLSASLRLNVNDRVNLLIEDGVMIDNNNHFTHFTGWLVEEDLM